MARISCKTPCRAKIRHDDENLQTAAEGSCGRCKGRRRSGWARGRVTATRLAPRPSRGGAAKLRWRFRSPHRGQGSGERAVGRKAVSQLGGRRAVEGGGTPPFEACSSPGASTVTRPVTRGRRLREGNGTVRGLRGALGGSRGFESLSAHLTRGCARGCRRCIGTEGCDRTPPPGQSGSRTRAGCGTAHTAGTRRQRRGDGQFERPKRERRPERGGKPSRAPVLCAWPQQRLASVASKICRLVSRIHLRAVEAWQTCAQPVCHHCRAANSHNVNLQALI